MRLLSCPQGLPWRNRSMREKRKIRIFFALWPDSDTRKQLVRVARRMPVQIPARRVPDYNLHMTLHFIGNVDFDEFACLRRQAWQVRAARFELAVDCHGHFSKAGIAWLGCGEVPTALSRLHDELGLCLQPAGYRPEARRYSPHVTSARKMRCSSEMPAFEPVSWKVDNFALIESRAVDNGVRYEVVETYPLA